MRDKNKADDCMCPVCQIRRAFVGMGKPPVKAEMTYEMDDDLDNFLFVQSIIVPEPEDFRGMTETDALAKFKEVTSEQSIPMFFAESYIAVIFDYFAANRELTIDTVMPDVYARLRTYQDTKSYIPPTTTLQ